MLTRITALRDTMCYGRWDDDRREVSEEGKDLAKRMGEELGAVRYDLIIHSPQTCSLETAALLLGTEDFESHEVKGLFPDLKGVASILNEAYTNIGNQPLANYLEIEDCRRALYAACCRVGDEIDHLIIKHWAREVLIVGPDLFLVAALYSLGEQEKIFADRALKECEGWIFTFDTTKCTVSDVAEISPRVLERV